MGVLNEEAKKVLTGANVAHLVTVRPDGSPHIAVVWVGLDGEQLVTAHLSKYRWLHNLDWDSRITLSVQTGGKDAHGLDQYLVVEGTAELTDGGGLDLVNRLAQVYLGEGTVWPPPDGTGPAGHVLRITPERVRGNGPWK
jgi:PPOX class probable F420-dependent enzyme